MIKAIIFDMDGVLVNAEPVYKKATMDMMKNVYNIDLVWEILVKTKGLRDKEEFELPKTTFSRDIETRVIQVIIAHCLGEIADVGPIGGNLIDTIFGRDGDRIACRGAGSVASLHC